MLIEFIKGRDDNWSFSWLMTHCLENFFGLVRESSRRNDRFSRILWIITQATVMVRGMHELDLRPDIRGGDDVGGTVIGKGSATVSPEYVDLFYHSFIVQVSLRPMCN
jgi:hypothetical protein